MMNPKLGERSINDNVLEFNKYETPNKGVISAGGFHRRDVSLFK